MRVFLVQHALENLAPERNRARVDALLRVESIPPASLILLPELFSLGTLADGFDADRADSVQREDREFSAQWARDTQSFVLTATVSSPGEAPDNKLGNLSLLFDHTGRDVLEYRKIHPFSLGGEDKIFLSGDQVRVHPVEGFILQPTVCYDLRFPELYRAGMRQGADLMTVQANWPESRKEHWEVLLRARAIENQAFVAGVNCVGAQRGTMYAGGSRIISPKGEVLAEGGAGECVVSADISADHVKAWRRTFPALRDRRPDGFWEEQGGSR
jgi:omega-amidase